MYLPRWTMAAQPSQKLQTVDKREESAHWYRASFHREITVMQRKCFRFTCTIAVLRRSQSGAKSCRAHSRVVLELREPGHLRLRLVGIRIFYSFFHVLRTNRVSHPLGGGRWRLYDGGIASLRRTCDCRSRVKCGQCKMRTNRSIYLLLSIASSGALSQFTVAATRRW